MDEEVSGQIIAHVERLMSLGLLAPSEDDGPELVAARVELARKREKLWKLDAATPASWEEGKVLARMIEAKKAEIQETEERVKKLARPNRVADLFTAGQDVASQWDALDVKARREVASILLTPALLGEVGVQRAPSHAPQCPVHERLIWRDAGTHAYPE